MVLSIDNSNKVYSNRMIASLKMLTKQKGSINSCNSAFNVKQEGKKDKYWEMAEKMQTFASS